MNNLLAIKLKDYISYQFEESIVVHHDNTFYVYNEHYKHIFHVTYDCRSDNAYIKFNHKKDEDDDERVDYYCNLDKLLNWAQSKIMNVTG